MKQLLAFAVLCIAQVDSAAADAPEYPSCHVEQQSLIAFSTASPTDTLKVKIVGTPCYKGRLTISITSANGVKLYSYAAGFKRHTAVQWDDPDMPKIAVELAKRIVAPTYKSTTADLPPWLPKTDYDEQTNERPALPRKFYERVRTQRLPIFQHPTHYEEWQGVIFEPKSKKAVVIVTGGV
jgi:hypothetical protein